MFKETPNDITYYRMMAQLAALLIKRQGGKVTISVAELDATDDDMAIDVSEKEMTFITVPKKGRA